MVGDNAVRRARVDLDGEHAEKRKQCMVEGLVLESWKNLLAAMLELNAHVSLP